MKTVSVSGSLRENVGKKDAKALRAKGMVPCVIYGGENEVRFYTSEKELMPLFTTPEVAFINITIDGKTYQTIVQEVQFHKVTDSILHVDFFELSDHRAITMAVPVRLEGSAPGVLKGGKLVKNFRKLKIKALPANMPEEILINISNMDILDEFHISDIAAENFQVLQNPSTIVVTIKTTRNVVNA